LAHCAALPSRSTVNPDFASHPRLVAHQVGILAATEVALERKRGGRHAPAIVLFTYKVLLRPTSDGIIQAERKPNSFTARTSHRTACIIPVGSGYCWSISATRMQIISIYKFARMDTLLLLLLPSLCSRIGSLRNRPRHEPRGSEPSS
jgi:hypothetical protein